MMIKLTLSKKQNLAGAIVAVYTLVKPENESWGETLKALFIKFNAKSVGLSGAVKFEMIDQDTYKAVCAALKSLMASVDPKTGVANIINK